VDGIKEKYPAAVSTKGKRTASFHFRLVDQSYFTFVVAPWRGKDDFRNLGKGGRIECKKGAQ
jgi:hypothetical protein